MITFFLSQEGPVIAVESKEELSPESGKRLSWLFSGAQRLEDKKVSGRYVGPRKEMVTPWSTNAVEMAANMGVGEAIRIERYEAATGENPDYDPMLQSLYDGLDQEIFKTDRKVEEIVEITDLEEYNRTEGLALSPQEIAYLKEVSKRLGRPLTDSEVFGFSQVNSEHCRHKIFNGTFVVDGEEKPQSLFKMIKSTSQANPNGLVSAYKDNVAFVEGPKVSQFAPADASKADYFEEREIDTVISLKAETHNFPTTVEPFNGAATGTGGEIRDRLGGGRASVPIAGTAVYMTAYPRHERALRPNIPMARPWLYHTPESILIKASNGASDFGNKFGQPLICGSVLTFEHEEKGRTLAYDKVIMLAGGVGFGVQKDAIKGEPEPGMKVVVMGGDNYRIGMGGGAVSSVETGQYANSIELNAVQRANPEMQKRVSNVIRALAEMESNPCVSIHDHGAGGHLNALSELVEATGGKIDMSALPVGDTTLSSKEIIGNESQERMGLVMRSEDVERVRKIAEREQAPFYVVGETTDDSRFVFEQKDGRRPIDLAMADMFGNSPKTVMTDTTVKHEYSNPKYTAADLETYLRNVLTLEAVGCKDWLTNKVDRSVTGRVARQQCQGPLQLPLSDCGVVALDYHGRSGIATSIGHAPEAALIDPAKGSVLSIAEALTNISGALLKEGLKSVSLSANWMWPCKNAGEDAALYNAVEACSEFAKQLGINIPTGKDSLSMTQKYGDRKVLAPGTVIISAAGEVRDIRRTATPVLDHSKPSHLFYIDFSSDELRLGGSAFYQSLGAVGQEAPTVKSAEAFRKAFALVQKLNELGIVEAQHDVSAGGLVTTLLEMDFSNTVQGLKLDLSAMPDSDLCKVLFAENPAVVLQVADAHLATFQAEAESAGVKAVEIGAPGSDGKLEIKMGDMAPLSFYIDELRMAWYKPSWALDTLQSGEECADERLRNYASQPVKFRMPEGWTGRLADLGLNEYRPAKSGVKAAIIREKGVNGDREMAYSLYLAGFDVKDVHMTDLTSGRETLEDVNMIVFCGGFSNSDVFGSAKGWAGQFLYNEKAKVALERFYSRKDTLSLGICNGCQLMIELNLVNPDHEKRSALRHNVSHKFESAFLSVEIPENRSVMFGNLAGSRLGIWVAHGEGRFDLPMPEKDYNVAARYIYSSYPGNPNGSAHDVAALTSDDGRHLAMMPHLERAIFPWQCGCYLKEHLMDQATPWLAAFVNARKWVEENRGK